MDDLWTADDKFKHLRPSIHQQSRDQNSDSEDEESTNSESDGLEFFDAAQAMNEHPKDESYKDEFPKDKSSTTSSEDEFEDAKQESCTENLDTSEDKFENAKNDSVAGNFGTSEDKMSQCQESISSEQPKDGFSSVGNLSNQPQDTSLPSQAQLQHISQDHHQSPPRQQQQPTQEIPKPHIQIQADSLPHESLSAQPSTGSSPSQHIADIQPVPTTIPVASGIPEEPDSSKRSMV